MELVWNTDSVAPRDGFGFWQEAVCRAVLSVATERRQATAFHAQIRSRSFGSARFAAFKSGRHAIVRDRSHIASLTDGGYLVSMQLRGRCNISQADDQIILQPGEIAIIDGEQPFRIDFPEDVERVVSVLPRHLLNSRAPWLPRRPTRLISTAPTIIELARRHLLHLAYAEPDPESGEAVLLTENLCNLITIGSAAAKDASALTPDRRLELMLLLARQNLFDPELSPAKLASWCKISVRTLHIRFKAMGYTWSQWLLSNRLDACRTALGDPCARHIQISQIAYQRGFNDLSHFNKSFRRAYAMTPGEYRQSCFSSTSHNPD